ncbi:MAG: rhomboid family intramembrane serine protease [Acidobacteriota bacterium]
MIPVHDVIPIRTRPAVTAALVFVLAGVAFVPGFRDPCLSALGSPAGDPHSWFVGLLARFAVHRDWVHVGSNMLALWVFGPVIEDRMGHGRYAGFALACWYAGAAAAMLPRLPPAVHVGSTGLAAGLVAAYTVQFPRSRAVVPLPAITGLELADVPAWFVSASWALLQLVDPVSPAAMVGGAIAGVAGWFVARRPERLRVEWWAPMRSKAAMVGRKHGR